MSGSACDGKIMVQNHITQGTKTKYKGEIDTLTSHEEKKKTSLPLFFCHRALPSDNSQEQTI